MPESGDVKEVSAIHDESASEPVVIMPDSIGQIVPSPPMYAVLPARVVSHALILVAALGIAATAYLSPTARLDGQSLERMSDQPSGLARSYFPQDFDDLSLQIPPVTVDTNPRRRGVIEHVVQPGDTVIDLANKYGISIDAIVWANQLADAHNITAGKRLQILPVSGVLYTVRPGESLADVSGRFHTSVDALAEFNDVSPVGELPAGIKVVIPGGRLEDIGRAVLASRSPDSGARGPSPRGVIDMPDGIDAVAPEPLKTMPVFDVGSLMPPAVVHLAPPVAIAQPAVSPPVEVPAPPRPSKHVVAAGENLKVIADRHSVTVASLIIANGLGNQPELIGVGEELVIPPPKSIVHKVREGETVLAVAERYNVTASAVIEANGLQEPFIIAAGQEMVVPEGEIEIEMVVQPRAPISLPAPPTGLTYVVEPGDSVVALGMHYGIETRAIIAANSLRDPYILSPGQKLILPGAQARQVSAPAPRPQPASAPAPRPAPVASAPPPAAPAPAPATASSGDGWGLVEAASRYLGYRYTWGGHAPQTGFDCTGFTWFVYRQLGNAIPMHDLWGQLQSGPRVGRDNLQAGDLVFFVNTYKAGLSHVGIYIGGGRFIHAQSERTGVSVTSLSESYWASRYYGASRPW
jgi:peptidoglycan DL-endopeptidase LytE